MSPYSGSLSLWLRSRRNLTKQRRTHSSAHSSIGTLSRIAPLQLLVSIRFQILFHRPPGLLFSFPSLYLFTIGQKKYLALPHRRGCFRRGFSSPVVLWIRNTCGKNNFAYRTITVCGSAFQRIQLSFFSRMPAPWGTDVSSAT